MSLAEHPVPVTIADLLKAIPVGQSRFFERSEGETSSIRSIITRIKRDHTTVDYNYTTRPEGAGLRVWRLS